jgi:hypothetical protein
MFVNTGEQGVFSNDNEFIINFNYLIKAHRLTGNFVIEHWNKPDKLWGYYCALYDKYYLVDIDRLEQPFYKPGIRVNIPYSDAIKPTDAILFTDTIVVIVNGRLTLTPNS